MTTELLQDSELGSRPGEPADEGAGAPAANDRDVGRRPDDLLSRAELEQLSRRRDDIGLLYFALHYALIVLGGWLTWQYRLGPAVVALLLIHSLIIGFLFSPLHECAHGTAFRTRWLNESVLWITAVVYIVPPYFFRYFHLGHHRYTQVPGRDPSLVLPEPATFRQYLWYCAGLWFWWRNISWIVRHAFGAADPSSAGYVPKARRHLMTREARILVAIYGIIAMAALATGHGTVVLLCWLLPRFLGEPIQRIIRVAEHVGCAETPELLDNTRTTLTNRFVNAIAWQMPYHAEHHLFPNVPFHALPAVHQHVAARVIVEDRGYIAGQREIVAMLRSHKPSRETNPPAPRPML